MKTKKKGFTIVELVIVIAVIAILAAVLIPTFAGIIKKANESTDTQLVRNLNTALASDNKEHKTMQSALDAAKEFGFDVDKINTKVNENEILWDSVNDCFVYLKDGTPEYIPNSKKTNETVENYQFWRIANDLSDQTYSIYAGKGWTAETVDNLTVGFDAGEFKEIESIAYNRSTATKKQDVVIRTNGGTLTINAKAGATKEETDSIIHYGYAEELVGSQLGAFSYHENGSVGFAKVEKGHFVIENSGSVNVLYVTGTLTGETAVSIEKTDRGVVGSAYCTDDSVVGTSAGNVDLTKVTSEETEEFLKNDSLFRKEIDSNGVEWRLISTSNELKAYAEKVNAGLFCSSEDKFKLANDIDLSNIETWTPISSANKSNVAEQYNGHFDGNNKVIKNLNISNGTQFLGLFGYVYGPTIENVRLENSQIAGSKYIGSLVGYVNGDATIRNCSNDVTSKVTCTGSNSGGIVGVLNTGSNIVLDGLKNYATVSGTRPGGIVGDVTNSAEVTISNCENNGKILAGTGYAGGIVSALQSGKITIENCANNADISDFTGNYKANICAWLTDDVSIVIKNKTTSRDDLCVLQINYGTVTINGVIYVQSTKFVADWKTTSCQELSKDKLDLILDFYCWVRDRNYISKNTYYQGDYSYLIKHFSSIAASWNKVDSVNGPSYEEAEKEYCTEKGITYSSELFEKTWTTGILYEIK